MSKEAMQQALEALEYIEHNYMSLPAPAEKAITALREALAEQPAQQQEPTATELSNGLGLALHDAVLIRIGGSDEATKQACARIDKLVEKYRAEHPDTQPAQQEPVAVKHMMRWVDGLKKLSDNGKHMKIPSELSAGTCWELAIELEQFIKSPPAQRTWVELTDDDVRQCSRDVVAGGKENSVDRFAYAIEAKLKEKNT